jgi:hypothetical protein
MELLECNKFIMNSYLLKEISQWQKEIDGQESKIFLPSLQRGFVWKPNQIEALWDSVFRGYPVGAILMSKDVDDNRNLLDGQQRCTSIALGHFNPFKNNNEDFLSLKHYKPSIWLDIAPEQKVSGQKFIFRCLTQSHPWGYQLRESTKTLSMSDRKNALAFFKEKQSVERYTDLQTQTINPWDSHYPIPLAFVLEIESNNFEDFKEILLKKANKIKIKTKHSKNEFVNYSGIKDDELQLIHIGYENYKRLQIPEIIIDSNVLKEDDETLNNESEDPTLFVRLNSAGTRISGEELNYSIYKAHFPRVKDLVEKIGASYIAPSKVISLFSRLSACELTGFSQYQKEFTIQTFRKKIAEVDFKKNLQQNIEGNAEVLLLQAISILKNNDSNFSIILLKQIIVANSDLFFVLLAYIRKIGFFSLSEIDKKEIASSYVYILWFHKDNKKVANVLFNILSDEQVNSSWKSSLEILVEKNLILPIINPSLLRLNLENIVINRKVDYNRISTIKEENLLSEEIIKVLTQNDDENLIYENWNLFINRICWNKALLLYAQKEYLNSKFSEFNQFENIDDTNRPWDWDHIFPNSWVYNNRGINPLVKSWVNTIGNFRALSYDDNRSESNKVSPKDRFENDDIKRESFINTNDFPYWNQIDNSFRRVTTDEKKVSVFLNAVVHRMVNIYQKWYNNYYV